MERQKSVTTRMAVAVIILFHLVGIIGLTLPNTRPLFIYLTPFHLLLMLMVMFFSYGRMSIRLASFFILIFIGGYIVECLGVHKNWLFGDYDYGNALGYKWHSVPPVIGVNWFLLIFSTGTLLQKTKIRKPAIRILTGAAILVLLDLLIEPVAAKLDYWKWTNDTVPFKNYAGWFLVSLIMLWLFEVFRFKRLSYAAPVLLIAQFVFFAVLNLL